MFREFFMATRWREWHDSKIPLFMVAAYYLSAQASPSATIQSLGLLMLLLMTIAAFGYVINDFADWEADREAGKAKSCLSRKMTGWLAFVLLASALLLSILLDQIVWFWFTLITLCLLAAGYSLPPVRLKERGWVGVAAGALAQRVLPLLLVFTVYPTDWLALLVLPAHSLFVGLRWMLIHQWQDAQADNQSAISTYILQSGRLATLNRLRWIFILEVLLLLCALTIMAARIPILSLGWISYGVLQGLLWPVWERIGWHQAMTSYAKAPLADFYGLFWPLTLAIYLAALKPSLVVFVALEILWKRNYWRAIGGMLWRRFHRTGARFSPLDRTYRRKLRRSVAANHPLVQPLVATVAVHSGCDSSCAYCGVWRHKRDVRSISLSEADVLLPQLKALGVRLVILSGGEPLLNRHLPEIIQIANELELQTQVITNGLLLTAKRLKSLAEAGLTRCVLSLDALVPEIYSRLRGVPLERAHGALEAMLEVQPQWPGLKLGTITVLTRLNLSRIPDLVIALRDLSQNKLGLSFQPVQPTGGRSNLALLPTATQGQEVKWVTAFLREQKKQGTYIVTPDAFLDKMEQFLLQPAHMATLGCSFGFTHVNITANLELYACCGMTNPLANLHSVDPVKFWHAPEMASVRARMIARECRGCFMGLYSAPELFDFAAFLAYELNSPALY